MPFPDSSDCLAIVASLHKARKPRGMHKVAPHRIAAWYGTPQPFVRGPDSHCVEMSIETVKLIVAAHWRREELELKYLT